MTPICSLESSAYYLTGGMEKEEPVVSGKLKIKLHWGGKPLTSDSFKIKWLRQYQPEQIAEFRREWEESIQERDKIALRELDRLLSTEMRG
jgi:hypothetical protein